MSTTNNISFEELTNNITNIFDSVRSERKTVIVEYANGEKLMIKLLPVVKMKKNPRTTHSKIRVNKTALKASAGSWKDVDTDALIRLIYESRTISTRPSVTL